MVEIYDNRIEITNPGGLVSGVPHSEFGKRSFARNPLIFGLLERIDMVEKIGSGVQRMREAMQDEDLPLPEFSLEGIFTVTLYRPVDFENWLALWTGVISDNQVNMLRAIHENPDITIPAMSKALGLARSTVEKNIQKLKELGLLERIGTDKTGSWSVIYKTAEKDK